MMTEEEKQNQYQEDNFVLNNYPGWTQRERLMKRPFDNEAWRSACQAIRNRQYNDNLEARRTRFAREDAARATLAAERDVETDRHLEPEKIRLRNQWLADHPGKTSQDFDRQAWTHLRQNLLEQERQEVRQANLAAGAESGRYLL